MEEKGAGMEREGTGMEKEGAGMGRKALGWRWKVLGWRGGQGRRASGAWLPCWVLAEQSRRARLRVPERRKGSAT